MARRQTHSKPACPWLGAALQQQEKWGDGAGMGALPVTSPPAPQPALLSHQVLVIHTPGGKERTV